ncbi:hypothetical protein HK097_010663 [Rhizophlyctis rosea]|uniref:Uncharacterized protein n=1 Tax=Rhizophlyctis rosea TaxID=64517 RepID=A0AAD5SHZ5_9FUNG|nr:hypothetical protein HK097_010663 [Rhizophlyctis rosea]
MAPNVPYEVTFNFLHQPGTLPVDLPPDITNFYKLTKTLLNELKDNAINPLPSADRLYVYVEEGGAKRKISVGDFAGGKTLETLVGDNRHLIIETGWYALSVSVIGIFVVLLFRAWAGGAEGWFPLPGKAAGWGQAAWTAGGDAANVVFAAALMSV